jgi:hypothetical protein
MSHSDRFRSRVTANNEWVLLHEKEAAPENYIEIVTAPGNVP